MKWWYWLILELLIIFGVIAWIYFFPSEIEDDFAKGMLGFGLFYCIEEVRKTMSENYTIEQNAGENRIEGVVVGISGTVKNEEAIEHRTYEQGLYDGYIKGFNDAYEQAKSVISNIPSLKIKVESCDIETMLKILKDKGVIKSWYYNGSYHAE